MATQKHLTLSGIIFCLPIILFYGCKKIDYSPVALNNKEAAAKFLTLPVNAPDAVKRVAEKLKTLNQNGNLVSSIAAQDGLAIWDKTIIRDRNTSRVANTLAREAWEDTIVCIPLVLEGKNYVNACIYAQLNGTVSLYLYKSKEYAGYGFGNVDSPEKNAEKFALQFMLLDYKTMGHQDFKLYDDRLFAKGGLPEEAVVTKRTLHITPLGEPDAPEGSYVQICEQTTYLDCTTNHSCCPDGSCSGCQQSCWHTRTTCVSVPVTIISWADWDWGTSTSTGTGTSGANSPFSGPGSNNSYTPPTTGGTGNAGSNYQDVPEYHCNPTPWLYDSNYPPCPTENIGNGWLPQDLALVQVNDIDRSHLTDPCHIAAFDKIGADKLKAELVKMYTETYVGTNKVHNLSIWSTSNVPGSNGQGVVLAGSAVDPTKPNTWEIDLSIDKLGNVLSEEAWVGMILHELVHSFIEKNNIGFNPFDRNNTHHTTMLNNWVTQIKDALKEICGMPDADALALALRGFDDVLKDPATGQFKPEMITKIQEMFGVNLNDAKILADQYYNGQKGTVCP